MASVTIKNIPETLMKKLRNQAKNNHRSVNGEIMHIIQGQVENTLDVQELLKSAERIRNRLKIQSFTDEELIRIKNEGRA